MTVFSATALPSSAGVLRSMLQVDLLYRSPN
jgi:hypothetical protein